MIEPLKQQALSLLRTALDNPNAEFRDGQWKAISSISFANSKLLKNNARLLVVQRTGWGKSLVYFLATRLLRDGGSGPTIIISPLLALMRNQIAAAQRLGINAETINSSNSRNGEWDRIAAKLLAGKVDVLLISPERLANEDFRNNILLPISKKIGLFVVDEAHCISDWGHDFRPDYRRIVRLLQALPSNLPVLATTATANNRVVNDIKAQINSIQLSRGSLTRNSLQLQNISLPSQAERLAWLAENLPTIEGSGIIYTLTVADAERVADWLAAQNIRAKAYHARSEDREALEDELLDNEIKALVATTALGMGFDKPDLAFVIHYQRPGSVVHYYQQVGRAGRAVDQAYGILLSGDEDDEINNYFIEKAFPPEAHTQQVLDVLDQAEAGLSIYQLQTQLNLSQSQINKVLKLLSIESPSPVQKQGSKWYATAINYQPNQEKIAQLIKIRQQEQHQMQAYMTSKQCLMAFLSQALDDPSPQPCGKCAVCLNTAIVPTDYSTEMVNRAVKYLQRGDRPIQPRKQWPSGMQLSSGWRGNIKPQLRAEVGRAVCLWGDAGWGELVKQGKYQNAYFDDLLVDAAVEMIRRSPPQPMPTWVTCIPSLVRPNLVPNFAQRLAAKLDLPFMPAVTKVKHNQPQKSMNNSFGQVKNLDRAFEIDCNQMGSDAVFLVDDIVDSRWTFTVVAALLRNAGSSKVFPIALAANSLTS